MLMRLVHEGVASRIRHRALLDVLANGQFDFDTYKNRYADLLKRDRDALLAKTMLSSEDFTVIFKGWMHDESARYGLPQVKVVGSSKAPRAKVRSQK